MSYPTSPVPKPLSIENTPAKKYLVALLMFDSILAVGRNNKEVLDEIQAEVTATGTLTDAQEAGTWVYLRFTDSGRAYAFSKKEVKNQQTVATKAAAILMGLRFWLQGSVFDSLVASLQ
jgi:hypothetical protein